MASAEGARGDEERATGPDSERAPDSPTDLNARSWKKVLKRTFDEFRDDGLTDWAAALTYYAILAIFPALIVLVSVLGLIGDSATQPLIDNVEALAPGPARDIVLDAIRNLQRSQGAAGVLFIVGILAAFYSASGYIGAFTKAANVIWDVEEGRPFYKTIPLRLAVTLLMMVLIVLSIFGIVVSGGIAESLGDTVGVGDTAVTAWGYAKWPVIILMVSLMFSVLYYATPNVKQPGFRWVTPGGLLAVLVWILASAAFAFYVSNFGSYNKTYGALGGAITFLVWLWITNIAVLLGAELNAEIERGRQIEGGMRPEDKEPFLEPREAADED